MALDGAKFVCLKAGGDEVVPAFEQKHEEGDQTEEQDERIGTQTLMAKGRKFTVGYYMNCDYVLEDQRAEGVHCEISCDAFGRVTIHNFSEKHPISVNGQIINMKRPLLHQSRITILDRDFLWLFPQGKANSPEKSIAAPEQPPNSCPDLRLRWVVPKRLTVHKFAYSIQSDDEGNTSAEISNSLVTPEKPKAVTSDSSEEERHELLSVTSAETEKKSIDEEVRETYDDSPEKTAIDPTSIDILGTPKVNLINCTQNKENKSTEKKQKLLSVCMRSDVVITSFSPRETGIRIEKSFTAVLKPTTMTPKSVYSTPKSILSDYNDDGSRDFIDFSTPATSKKTLAKRAVTNSSMHLIDLTTPTKLRPNSPQLKTDVKSASKHLSEKVNREMANSSKLLEEGITMLPSTPVCGSGDANMLPQQAANSAESVISTTSSPFVIELSSEDSTPGVSPLSQVCSSKTPKEKASKLPTTPMRTPQSLMKRAILTSAKKQASVARLAAAKHMSTIPAQKLPGNGSNSPFTPVSNASTKRVLSLKERQSFSAPGRRSLTVSKSSPRANLSATEVRSIITSTPMASSSSSVITKLRNASPLHGVRKSLGNTAIPTHISKSHRSVRLSRQRTPPSLSAQLVAKARKSLYSSSSRLSTSRARNLVVAAVSLNDSKNKTTDSIKVNEERSKAQAVAAEESNELSRTFIVDDSFAEEEAPAAIPEIEKVPVTDIVPSDKVNSLETITENLKRTFSADDIPKLETDHAASSVDVTEVHCNDLELVGATDVISSDRLCDNLSDGKNIETEVIAENFAEPIELFENVTESTDCVIPATMIKEIFLAPSVDKDEKKKEMKKVECEVYVLETDERKANENGEKFKERNTLNSTSNLETQKDIEMNKIDDPAVERDIEIIETINVSDEMKEIVESNVDLAQTSADHMECTDEQLPPLNATQTIEAESNAENLSGVTEEEKAECIGQVPLKVVAENDEATANPEPDLILSNVKNDKEVDHKSPLQAASCDERSAGGESEETAMLLEEIEYVLNKSDELQQKQSERQSVATSLNNVERVNNFEPQEIEADDEAKGKIDTSITSLEPSELKTEKLACDKDSKCTPAEENSLTEKSGCKTETISAALQSDDDEKENLVVIPSTTSALPNELGSKNIVAAGSPSICPKSPLVGLKNVVDTTKIIKQIPNTGEGEALEGLQNLLGTPYQSKRDVVTVTPRRSARRRASASADMTPTYTSATPKRTTRRRLSESTESISTSGILLTPKRITARRPSLSIDDDSLLTPRARSSRVKCLTVFEENIEDMGTIIEEGQKMATDNVTKDVEETDDNNETTTVAEQKHTEIENADLVPEIVEESICEEILENQEMAVKEKKSIEQIETAQDTDADSDAQSKRYENMKLCEHQDPQHKEKSDKSDNAEEILDKSDYEYGREVTVDKEVDLTSLKCHEVGQHGNIAEISETSTKHHEEVVLEVVDEENVTIAKPLETETNKEAKENSQTPKSRKSVKFVGTGVHEDLIRTPNSKVRDNSAVKLESIPELMQTPKTERPVSIISKEEEPSTSHEAQLAYLGMRELLQTPKFSSTPLMKGVREMLKTPKAVCKSPELDGMKQLMETPIKNTVDDVEANKNCAEEKSVAMLATEMNETPEDVENFLKSPSAKDMMMPGLPSSVIIAKSSDSVALVATTEYDLNATGGNVEGGLGDLFKTPVSTRPTKAYLELVTKKDLYKLSEKEEENKGGSEENKGESEEIEANAQSPFDDNNSTVVAELSAEDAFDELMGQRSILDKTPPRSVYMRKVPSSGVQPSPFSASDVISDLPPTDVQEWVDNLECGAPPEDEDIKQEIEESENSVVTVEPTFEQSAEMKIDTQLSSESMVNISVATSSVKLVQGSLCQDIKDIRPLGTIEEDSTGLNKTPEESEMSGINLLDQTHESVSLEPLLVSDSESASDSKDREDEDNVVESSTKEKEDDMDKTTSVCRKDLASVNEVGKTSSGDTVVEPETTLMINDQSSPVKEDVPTVLLDSDSNSSEEVKDIIKRTEVVTVVSSDTEELPEDIVTTTDSGTADKINNKLEAETAKAETITTEFENFREDAVLVCQRSSTPNQYKARSKLSRKTLGSEKDLQASALDFEIPDVKKCDNKNVLLTNQIPNAEIVTGIKTKDNSIESQQEIEAEENMPVDDASAFENVDIEQQNLIGSRKNESMKLRELKTEEGSKNLTVTEEQDVATICITTPITETNKKASTENLIDEIPPRSIETISVEDETEELLEKVEVSTVLKKDLSVLNSKLEEITKIKSHISDDDIEQCAANSVGSAECLEKEEIQLNIQQNDEIKETIETNANVEVETPPTTNQQEANAETENMTKNVGDTNVETETQTRNSIEYTGQKETRATINACTNDDHPTDSPKDTAKTHFDDLEFEEMQSPASEAISIIGANKAQSIEPTEIEADEEDFNQTRSNEIASTKDESGKILESSIKIKEVQEKTNTEGGEVEGKHCEVATQIEEISPGNDDEKEEESESLNLIKIEETATDKVKSVSRKDSQSSDHSTQEETIGSKPKRGRRRAKTTSKSDAESSNNVEIYEQVLGDINIAKDELGHKGTNPALEKIEESTESEVLNESSTNIGDHKDVNIIDENEACEIDPESCKKTAAEDLVIRNDKHETNMSDYKEPDKQITQKRNRRKVAILEKSAATSSIDDNEVCTSRRRRGRKNSKDHTSLEMQGDVEDEAKSIESSVKSPESNFADDKLLTHEPKGRKIRGRRGRKISINANEEVENKKLEIIDGVEKTAPDTEDTEGKIGNTNAAPTTSGRSRSTRRKHIEENIDMQKEIDEDVTHVETLLVEDNVKRVSAEEEELSDPRRRGGRKAPEPAVKVTKRRGGKRKQDQEEEPKNEETATLKVEPTDIADVKTALHNAAEGDETEDDEHEDLKKPARKRRGVASTVKRGARGRAKKIIDESKTSEESLLQAIGEESVAVGQDVNVELKTVTHKPETKSKLRKRKASSAEEAASANVHEIMPESVAEILVNDPRSDEPSHKRSNLTSLEPEVKAETPPKTKAAPRRTRKASALMNSSHQSAHESDLSVGTPPSVRSRNLPRRAATAQDHNYDESSDTEAQVEFKRRLERREHSAVDRDNSTAEKSTTSRGRTRKPTAKVQQYLEEERAKAGTPKRRLLLGADTPTSELTHLPARRGRKASTIEIETPITPQTSRRGRSKTTTSSTQLAEGSEVSNDDTQKEEKKKTQQGRREKLSPQTDIDNEEAVEQSKEGLESEAIETKTTERGKGRGRARKMTTDSETKKEEEEKPKATSRSRKPRVNKSKVVEEVESHKEPEDLEIAASKSSVHETAADSHLPTMDIATSGDSEHIAADISTEEDKPLAEISAKALKRTGGARKAARSADSPVVKRSRRNVAVSEHTTEHGGADLEDTTRAKSATGRGRKVVRFEPSDNAVGSTAITDLATTSVSAAPEAEAPPPPKRVTRTRRK